MQLGETSFDVGFRFATPAAAEVVGVVLHVYVVNDEHGVHRAAELRKNPSYRHLGERW